MFKIFHKRKNFSEDFNRMEQEFQGNKNRIQIDIEKAKKEFDAMEQKFSERWNSTQKK